MYASATGTNEVVAIDEATYKITARMPGGVYPDGMAYAPDVNKLYVSDEHGGTDTVIDVRANTPVATIRLEVRCCRQPKFRKLDTPADGFHHLPQLRFATVFFPSNELTARTAAWSAFRAGAIAPASL